MVAVVVPLSLVLAACGTLELEIDPLTPSPEGALSQVVTPVVPFVETTTIPTPTQSPPAPLPTASTSPATLAAEETPSPTSKPSPAAGQPSSLWATYRDMDYGFGFAFPCFWLNQPSTISSYDGNFALEHSIGGHWIDSRPPSGVVKIDIGVLDYAEYGLDLEIPLGEAITTVAGDPYNNGRPAFESIEETTIAGKNAQRVYLGEQIDSWGGDFQRESYYFPIEPGRWFRFFVLPTEAIDSPSVQGILTSLALSSEEPITTPTFDPDPPVAGREIILDEEASFCFQYPANYELETYDPGPTDSETISLKLERPLYTVGLTAQAQMVGQEAILDEQMNIFLNSFSDEAVTGIRRNPADIVAGIDYRLGNQPAEVLDGVPGLVPSLNIFAKNGDMFYQVVFTPSPFDNPQAAPDIWALYNVVAPSFSFLP